MAEDALGVEGRCREAASLLGGCPAELRCGSAGWGLRAAADGKTRGAGGAAAGGPPDTGKA